MKTTARMFLAGALAAAIAAFGAGSPASAATVSAAPATFTPYITSADSTVRQLAQCGSTMYAVGTFTTIGSPLGGPFTRNNVFSFNATTGVVSSWNPNVNGTVYSLALTSNCATAYLAGAFTTAHGTAVKNLVKVSTSTGAVDTAFKPVPSGSVYRVLISGTHLLAGGSFTTIGGVTRAAMASLSLSTGKADSYVNLNITGALVNSTRKVYSFALSNGGTKLLVMGSFLAVGGVDRQQIFMVDLGTTSASLDTWYSPLFDEACKPYLSYYLQAAAWSPDDATIYTGTTGREGVSPLCDTVAAFSSAADSALQPMWVNPTGCDSLFTVAADDTNVYAGGHQRWMSNFGVCEQENPNSVPRQGIADLSPADGSVTPWDPSRSRGHGADAMLLTSTGLWVGSDNFFASDSCAGVYHPGICFFPR